MSKENWDDKEYVLEQVKKDGTTLKYASDRLKDDKAIVLVAVSKNGLALEYASDRLKDNEEIVLATIKQDGVALQYASCRLQNDKRIVLDAVSQNSLALIFASDRLKSNVPFCIECANIDSDCTLFFKGEAKEIFQAHHNDIYEVEQVYTQQQQQNKANEALLSKLTTGEIVVPTNHLFKRKLLDV
jgi:hypothetical protein